MKAALRFGGHPLHAILTDFPLVFLLTWVAFDSGALVHGSLRLWAVGGWMLTAGVLAGALTALVGFVDYLRVARLKPEATTTATAHLMLMATAVTVPVLSLLFRGADPPRGGANSIIHIATLASVTILLSAGGWFGGHLVFHHRVGVDE